jgi:hypothetical protein
LKTKLSALVLSAILGVSSLVAIPAQASTGDCTIESSVATCTGPNLQALKGDSTVTYLMLDNAPLDGDVLKTLPALDTLNYQGTINVDLREAFKAPALKHFSASFTTNKTTVEVGKRFVLPTFTAFDGKPFSLEIENYFQADLKSLPVQKVGLNTFVAQQPTQLEFLDSYYTGTFKSNGRSLSWQASIGEQSNIQAYSVLSWLGTGKFQTWYSPTGAENTLSPSATVVPAGTNLFIGGSKYSTGFRFGTVCQWSREGVVVQKVRQGGCNYKLSKADSGKKLNVKASHNVDGGDPGMWRSTTETFSKTFTVQDPVLLKLGRIDSAQVGKKLTAKVTGTPAGANLKYQWLRAGKSIKGATKSTYTPTVADLGKRLSYTVTGSKAGMYPAVHTSTHTSQVVKGKYGVTKSPSISGKAVYGQTLKVNPGTRSTKPQNYKYQWLRDGKTIKNATKSTYKLGTSDIGDKISVKVTASGAGFATQTSTTSKTKTVAKAKFSLKKNASVSGKMKVGSKLKANPGKWSPKPEKYKYQWYRSGAPISKATKSTYKVTSRDRGKVIYIKVTASKKGYATRTSTSSVK